MRWTRSLAVAAVLTSCLAHAEISRVGFHVQPGVALDFKNPGALGGLVFKIDVALASGLVALQAQGYGLGAQRNIFLANGALFGGGLGLRLRLLNDEKGYLIHAGPGDGNLWSNLFFEAHLDYSHGGFGLGADVGVGAELSVADGLRIAPTAKFFFTSFTDRFEPVLMLGLEFSLGAPHSAGDLSDEDGDGILAKDDQCVTEAEDKDGFEDQDGCPDPDNDQDGIEDKKDKCPDSAEDKKGDATDGCPQNDDDQDGVQNDKDQCKAEKEDKDGFKDDDGCPDPDNDQDGVLDEKDKCPAAAEDKDGFQDDDGCPDPDNDGDGIADDKDKCPTQKGTEALGGCPVNEADKDADGVDDKEDACPGEKGLKETLGCTGKVGFAAGKATIDPKSTPLLDQIVAVLKANPELKLSVEAHTDNAGDAEKNRKLSQDRAEAVKAYLVKKGVDKARLQAKGWGGDKPAQPNDTDAGKEANRRVEFLKAP